MPEILFYHALISLSTTQKQEQLSFLSAVPVFPGYQPILIRVSITTYFVVILFYNNFCCIIKIQQLGNLVTSPFVSVYVYEVVYAVVFVFGSFCMHLPHVQLLRKSLPTTYCITPSSYFAIYCVLRRFRFRRKYTSEA